MRKTKTGSAIRELSYTPAKDGDDVMLTIDINLQSVVEKALEDLIAKIDEKEEKQLLERYADYEKATNDDVEGIKTAKTGAAVVMNVNTGRCLPWLSYLLQPKLVHSGPQP